MKKKPRHIIIPTGDGYGVCITLPQAKRKQPADGTVTEVDRKLRNLEQFHNDIVAAGKEDAATYQMYLDTHAKLMHERDAAIKKH